MKFNIYKSKRIFFLLLTLVLSLPVLSETVIVDGIHYQIDQVVKEVSVKSKESKYSGAVIIPESIVYNSISYSVTSISDNAFKGCEDLTSITIPNSVISIGADAFSGCESLTSFTIPSSVVNIGGTAFNNCKGLKAVHISDLEAYFKINFTNYSSNPLRYAHHLFIDGQEIKELVVPNSVRKIGNYAFTDCLAFTSVIINHNVTSIGAYAFYGCTGLSKIELPHGVTSIGQNAFYGCSALQSVTLGDRVQSIGEQAFYGCSNLREVICRTKNLPTAASNTFGYAQENMYLYVPYTSLEYYRNTVPWNTFKTTSAIHNKFNLTVSSVGYATLYLDFDANIPSNVMVYVASEVDGQYLRMDEIQGVLPAYTAVIVMADQGTYTFTENYYPATPNENNLLRGSVYTMDIEAEKNMSYYVLSAPDGEVGMYLAQLREGKFQNNANKAYLIVENEILGINEQEVDTETAQLSRRLIFDFSNETPIEEVISENVVRNGQLFDLSGRRVQHVQKGIYIKNGKIVLM